jgi:hypothetical protein
MMGKSHPGFWILLLLISLVVPCVSAIAVPNYTPIFNIDGGDQGTDFVHYNESTRLASQVAPNTTPWEHWILAGLIGLGLFILSLLWSLNMTTPYVESAAIISAIAWVPIGFCSYASFAIDRIAGSGVTSQVSITEAAKVVQSHEFVYMESHLIYSEPIIGILMLAFLVVAILNTVRILALHKVLKGQSDRE